jgi:hypothetical protein
MPFRHSPHAFLLGAKLRPVQTYGVLTAVHNVTSSNVTAVPLKRDLTFFDKKNGLKSDMNKIYNDNAKSKV